MIRKLQMHQRERYTCVHHDISCFPYPERIKHLTLHLAKYAAALAHEYNTPTEFIRTVVDVFIVCLSAAEILEIDLSNVAEKWGASTADQSPLIKPGLAIWERESKVDVRQGSYFRDLSIIVGRMAAACEALDHRESVHYRSVLHDPIVELCRISFIMASALSLDLMSAVTGRWQEAKAPEISD